MGSQDRTVQHEARSSDAEHVSRVDSGHCTCGDRLWVRESLREDAKGWVYAADAIPITLMADDQRVAQMVGWAHHKQTSSCPSIHMPRFASRITLELTEVRVERLQQISADDALAEGVEVPPDHVPWNPCDAYADLWDSINGEREGCAWHENPFVWIVSFRRLRP